MTNAKAVTFFLLTGLLSSLFMSCKTNRGTKIETPIFAISWPSSSVGSWEYTLKPEGEPIEIKLPVFEIDGKQIPAILSELIKVKEPSVLRNGANEYIYEGAFQTDTTIRLQVKFRVAENNPVVRFCYSLKTSGGQKLTKKTGTDNLTYLSFSMKEFPEIKEIRLSVFNEMIHSCDLGEAKIYESDFTNSGSAVGPIILGNDGQNTFLCAYEHDSMYPNNFLEYQFNPDKQAELKAQKGNYFSGQAANGYSTVWFEIAGVIGDEDVMAEQFRTFILKYQTENMSSRKPYIYYNSWGRQERVKWAGGQYLTTMNLDYTLREIDRAHEMGIEFYVLDAGWFDRTGDWGVNLKNFPDGFKQVREKIEGYGMKLGVWMDPAKAAITSQAFLQNQKCIKSWNGNYDKPWPVGETKESVDMCLISPYWEYYADKLIELYKKLGISYFYLDGVGQSGCNDPGHFHGSAE
ncbi:MAG: alpha-galactosidase, partial [Bacteroidales bacterium]